MVEPGMWAACAAALSAAAGCAGPAPLLAKAEVADLGSIRTVAVFPFSGGTSSEGARPGDAVAGALVEALRQEVPQFQLVERTRIADLLAERRGAAVTAQEKETLGIAKLLNVDAVVAGVIEQYAPYNDDKDEFSVGATIRIVDVRSGRVVWTGSGEGNRMPSYVEAVRETVRMMIRPLKELPAPAGLKGGY
jgi:curli biogenesis system outer membrane secretion channel CsgG